MLTLLRNIFILFYSIGALLLPMSDFSTMVDLPRMYEHCKMNEDKDMTVVDFVTDHLVNIDGIFDKHDHGDEQKPHKSIDFTSHFSGSQYFQEIRHITFRSAKIIISSSVLISDYQSLRYAHNPSSFLLRPPIFE